MADTKIKKIKLSETEIYDIADPAAVNNDYQFLQYKGVATEAQIKAQTAPKVGDYWFASDKFTAYICTKAAEGTTNAQWLKTSNLFMLKINGTIYDSASKVNPPSIFTPTTGGAAGQVLTSNGGNTPVWSDTAGGGPDIVISASQPSGQKSGDFWYQIVT